MLPSNNYNVIKGLNMKDFNKVLLRVAQITIIGFGVKSLKLLAFILQLFVDKLIFCHNGTSISVKCDGRLHQNFLSCACVEEMNFRRKLFVI